VPPRLLCPPEKCRMGSGAEALGARSKAWETSTATAAPRRSVLKPGPTPRNSFNACPSVRVRRVADELVTVAGIIDVPARMNRQLMTSELVARAHSQQRPDSSL